MRINIRRQTWIKSVSYALLFFALLLFSKSFLPALWPGLCRALGCCLARLPRLRSSRMCAIPGFLR